MGGNRSMQANPCLFRLKRNEGTSNSRNSVLRGYEIIMWSKNKCARDTFCPVLLGIQF